MLDIFLQLLNMSLTASWIVLAVLVFRFLFPKTPKWISCLLWGIVALRLLMPMVMESTLSLIPSGEVIPQDITVSQTPAIHSGIPVVNSAVNPLFAQQLAPETHQLQKLLTVLAYIWLAGVWAMVLYSVATYLRLRWQVRASLCVRDHVYICDDVESPFVLGFFRPKIYLPSGLDEGQMPHVLAHENAHIRRRDHWWKPLGYGLLCLHWFNPLMWVAYIFLCRDIESACDEKVVSLLDAAGKKSYSEALLACSIHRRLVMACPIAFGEISVKSRIRGVLHYKKPTLWILIGSAVACVVAAVCFLTNPVPCDHVYESQITQAATCTAKGMQTYTCTLCQHSYTKALQKLEHTYDAGVVTAEPTCTALGSLVRSCSCGKTMTEAIPMTHHIAGEPRFVVEANCTDMGQTSATCSACGIVFVTSEVLPNGVHDLVETELVAATCGAAGEGEITCTRCDYHESCTYEKLPHETVCTDQHWFACTLNGTATYECIHCGNVSFGDLAPRGHDMVSEGNGHMVCANPGCPWETWSSGGVNLLDDMSSGGGTSTTPSLPVIQWDPNPIVILP